MRALYFLLLTLFLYSCADEVTFRENREIPSEGWSKNEPAVFEPVIKDNSKLYNTFVILRHDGRFQFNNLFLFIQITDPAGNHKTDTVECILADQTGRWYGSGLGDILTMKMAYRQKVAFPDTGKYTFRIEQAMRVEPLEFIKDISFSIEQIDPK
ncbi:MAG: hypothetical protein CVU05_13880 [Bacteroidetes bacterium HGW-Bacteroidetes-21]|jgi:gliding motility-associated lipoprotein GldH|nr:MAG: hypothetical protein CVU05_13880 [Bacteroidetes bacterium HGW-Bacteroidetes-21]